LSTPFAHPIRGVIFDLDGTLVDSSAEIATALEATFRELGLSVLTKAAVEALIGRGVRVLVERALMQVGGSGLSIDEVVHRFEKHYEKTVGTNSALYPGAREAMTRLRAAEIPMAVVTNKPRFFTEHLLEGVGAMEFLSAIVAGDDGFTRKPSPDMLLAACRRLGTDPHMTLMLGDSDNDIVAARAANLSVWCVPYGYNEGKPPEALDCDRLVDDLDVAARLILGD
jgi:phosphoglycolate phosphatase